MLKKIREKLNYDQEQDMNRLRRSNINFATKHEIDGDHIIICLTQLGGGFIDFYPETGHWSVRGKKVKGFGVRALVNFFYSHEGREQTG